MIREGDESITLKSMVEEIRYWISLKLIRMGGVFPTIFPLDFSDIIKVYISSK